MEPNARVTRAVSARTMIVMTVCWGSMCSCATADESMPLRFAGIFGDQMVLQRECKNAIWGQCSPNQNVTVLASWSDRTVTAVADDAGRWKATIDTPEAGGPFDLTVATNDQEVRLRDVFVGEVWICSGQSNMQWKMRGFGLEHFKEDVDKANYPRIRYCEIPAVIALEDQDDVLTKWTVCNPQTVLNLSAVGYFFGSRLHQELDVPIGLVSTNWGGSSAEAWVSPDVLRQDFPEFTETLDGYPAIAEKTGVLYQRGKPAPKGMNQRSPSVLYNSMLKPLIPFSFRGVIWYQGESNVERPKQYRTLFPGLIRDWRNRWGQGDFPFYFVQIAPFVYKDKPVSAAYLREAQMMTLAEPNTGMVVTMDVGDFTNIHPKQKKPVGERLARLALARDYGRDDLLASSPIYQSHTTEDDSIRIQFAHTGGVLMASDSQPLTHFMIAANDQHFVDADAIVDGETIVVRSENVTAPVAVRFAWGSGDMPNLVNQAGLPASSFRTDQWAIERE
ncbi:hypothetical protein Poly51_39130 [Rubripirellula tenax]|uniref:Sialate O-acetylesterase domain-containing protein n=1 Tax=Rubripirellula tenax TaxID=2528015 RepID=A0A5C6ETH0_9BACT|nr:sialate O-acetylesterase [Rubripirellula tenax]TWU50621.1 hypothetical protein Poly51_39130 [Rubripirellula tenax]